MGQAIKKKTIPGNDDERDIMLIGKIYKSFEALEETLGKLQLEEPLFITYMAKKSFADTVFSQIKHNNGKNADSTFHQLKSAFFPGGAGRRVFQHNARRFQLIADFVRPRIVLFLFGKGALFYQMVDLILVERSAGPLLKPAFGILIQKAENGSRGNELRLGFPALFRAFRLIQGVDQLVENRQGQRRVEVVAKSFHHSGIRSLRRIT